MWVHVNIAFKSENIWPLVDLAYFGLIELFAKYPESVRTVNWAEKELTVQLVFAETVICLKGVLEFVGQLARHAYLARCAKNFIELPQERLMCRLA